MGVARELLGVGVQDVSGERSFYKEHASVVGTRRAQRP